MTQKEREEALLEIRSLAFFVVRKAISQIHLESDRNLNYGMAN